MTAGEGNVWRSRVYRKSGNFRSMKFTLKKFLCWKLFVGSTSSKNISTRNLKSGRTYGESNCHGKVFFKEIAFAATTYIKKCGWRWLDRHLCAKGSPKTDRYAVAVKNEGTIIDIEHLPQKLSRVFLWRGSTQSQVWASSVSTWDGAEYNTHRNYS